MSYPNLPPALTPQRPLPGAFFQTPGPNNVPSAPAFSPKPAPAPAEQPSPASLPKLPPAASKSKSQTLSTEERAARTVNDTLTQEARYPDLDSYLSQGFSSDYDIPVSPSWAPFQKVKMYNIPDQIFDQYNRAQVSTSMGLFAELNHAWVAIDNALYIWDYTHPNPQLVGFEDQPNSINAVKLAKPRPGVFLPSITHLLVVSTTADVILLGMGCETTPTGARQVTLYQTGMSTSIRGLDIHVIASSDATGRIFFGGSSDNDVYELTYQQEEKWFQGRCSKVNHTSSRLGALTPSLSFSSFTHKMFENVEQMEIDDSRRLLYTLSSSSTIRVFHMKPDGTLALAITKPAMDIYANIGHIIASNETLNPKVPIVSISPIPAAEASRYHLMATTATGYRIYLSATGSYSWSPSPNGTNAPTSMQAHHVKTPPFDGASSSPAGPAFQGQGRFQPSVAKVPIHSLDPTRFTVRYPPGYFFCFTCKDPTQKTDTLFVSSPDSGRVARSQENVIPGNAAETAIWLSLGSRVEDVGLCSPSTAASATPGGFGNELAVQFDNPAAEIAILTNTGIHIIRRRRLVDMFAALVRGGGDGDEGLEGEVKNFIRTYGRSETLATALAVACGQGVEISADSRLTQINDPHVLEFARKVFIEYGGRPTMNENAVADNSTPAIDSVVPSPRHAGIALYMSRLLRTIWRKEIAKVGPSPGGAQTILPSVPSAKLQTIQRDLSALQEFFKDNKSFIEGLSGPEALARVSTKQEETALQAEHRALHSLVQLVSHTIEGISFILVLFDERVDEIVATLPDDSKQRFMKLTFEELFSTSKGHDIAKDLVKGIVNRNIAKGSNVETVADALRRRCGSFCSAEDVVIFKAQELLKRATEAGSNSELGRNLLNESLHLFQQVSESLPMDYLVSAVENFISNQFFAGAIQLALNVAARSDKANMALSWLVDGRPENDSRSDYFYFRKQCYDLIFKVIIAVDNLAAHDPGVVDGQLTVVAKRKNEAYGVISDSIDEVFLTSLYDWYLEQGWSERLLHANSAFVVTYLERKSTDDIAHADLLWRYYAQSERFFEAAKVQFHLAQSAFTLPLGRRIEYLGRARANASTFTPDVGRQLRQRLLQDISNLIDLANIQDDLLQRLKDDKRLTPERRTQVLADVDGPIMDISTLFNQYADPASYYDICLQIFYLADHRNPADIRSTWQHLLQDLHDETVENGEPQPYEAVIDKVRSLGSRLRMSDIIFPIPTLLPMLERYALEHQRGVGPATWVVDLFLDLGVAHETLYTVLESMYYTDEAPFHGTNRKYIAKDLLYLIEHWFHDTVRLGGTVFGSDVVAERITETLLLLQQGGNIPPEQLQLANELRTRVEDILR
ncbi:Non-repetitive/WGA-negative nucleoporin C-terminal-domain-containing protein [Aspergillus pseudonomiae]|uniref:Non-repetitive/WGA-negative nucleoporin C-terminal-domain-containing protein n=1 Tax=Aspergillus pseudonomiae TaxID=1506151 RepID=A0A5N7DSF6_9EURO|nr:Non-repetitive/WGA-negative nucleoporin C-terminal-domain-containing protein [Aspergillus pseudonomiae]KAB8266106.1 Non-repetitive/WGA-negative nucleoporin C-terminal-domain-containing protein [Aspergillus pseudonomiae]KAE8408973.1 Non-repetitive/WGA-negative nucleoporin C-terminal-domain-containing protein [Aspergillus pseudonomiae]